MFNINLWWLIIILHHVSWLHTQYCTYLHYTLNITLKNWRMADCTENACMHMPMYWIVSCHFLYKLIFTHVFMSTVSLKLKIGCISCSPFLKHSTGRMCQRHLYTRDIQYQHAGQCRMCIYDDDDDDGDTLLTVHSEILPFAVQKL